MLIITDWVFDDNLRPFLMSLGWFAGYTFDGDDWLAVRHGLEGTDQEAGCWFEYEFANKYPVSLQLALDPGTSVVHARVRCTDPIGPKVEAAFIIFQYFRVGADDH